MASPTSEIIKVFGARLSFPKLAKPEAYQEDQEKKFQATFLLDPSNPDHAAKIKEIKQAAGRLMREAYGPDFKPAGLKGKCFGDGNSKTKEDGSVLDGYENMFYIAVSNRDRPAVASASAKPVAEGDKEWPYGGCFVNGTLTLWAQNNKYGKRINGNLRGVQFVRDGEAFGAGPISAEDEFEALEDNSPVDSDIDDFDDDIDF